VFLYNTGRIVQNRAQWTSPVGRHWQACMTASYEVSKTSELKFAVGK